MKSAVPRLLTVGYSLNLPDEFEDLCYNQRGSLVGSRAFSIESQVTGDDLRIVRTKDARRRAATAWGNRLALKDRPTSPERTSPNILPQSNDALKGTVSNSILSQPE